MLWRPELSCLCLLRSQGHLPRQHSAFPRGCLPRPPPAHVVGKVLFRCHHAHCRSRAGFLAQQLQPVWPPVLPLDVDGSVRSPTAREMHFLCVTVRVRQPVEIHWTHAPASRPLQLHEIRWPRCTHKEISKLQQHVEIHWALRSSAWTLMPQRIVESCLNHWASRAHRSRPRLCGHASGAQLQRPGLGNHWKGECSCCQS